MASDVCEKVKLTLHTVHSFAIDRRQSVSVQGANVGATSSDQNPPFSQTRQFWLYVDAPGTGALPVTVS